MGIFLDFLIIPFLASYFILILKWENYNLHFFSLLISILLFYYSIYIVIIFNKSIFLYQFIESYYSNWQSFNNFEYLVGIDNISLFFLLLTSFIFPISILYLRQFLKYKYFKNFILYLYFLIFFLFQVFSVLDIFLFYFFFESILIPMFYIIIIFGSRYRKIRSVYLLILYTFIGSIFMLIGLILIYLEVGSFNMILLSHFRWDNIVQYYLWFFFFISFSIKIPMFPFYIWLPEAHVEAPTIGSVILAALLLKLGGYGFIRILIPIFYKATLFFLPFVFMLALISILYASLTIIRQVDIKKIIAYSSIIHMNIIVLGIFSLNTISLIGSIFFMIAHGIISSALFFLAGILYDRYKTRLIFYYGGLFNIMPIFSFFFFFFSFLNISFPGTIGFIGELLVLIGFLNINFFYTFLVILCLILSVIYSIWLLNRIIFGNFKKINNIYFYDLNFREFLLLIPFLVISIILGIKPSLCLDYLILI